MQFTLKRNGALYQLEPWEPSLGPLLTYRRRSFEFGRRRARPTITNEELFSMAPDGKSGMFPAGLFQRVVRHLKGRGHELKLEDYRDLAALMPAPVFEEVEALRPGQDQILVAVAGSDGGQLVGGTGSGKTFLITQICRMYPTLRIVVVSPRRPVVATIHENLIKALGSAAVGKYGGEGHQAGTPRRVSVSTVRSLLKAPIRDCDLLLFDEVHAVGHNQVAEMLAYVGKARKFGFTATPEGRGDGAELVIEALFGPVLVRIPYDEAVRKGLVSPIQVHRYHVRSAEVGPMTGPIVCCKRNGYWRNLARNEMIAAVARGSPEDEQVLIMTETLEHAILLHKLLPEFQVVHYGGSGHSTSRSRIIRAEAHNYRLNEKALSHLRREFMAGRLRKVIATTVWREGVDFPALSVLIRADGMTSPISSNQIPGRLSRLAEGKDKGVLVDFADEFSDWAERRAKARFAIYRKTGWQVMDKELT